MPGSVVVVVTVSGMNTGNDVIMAVGAATRTDKELFVGWTRCCDALPNGTALFEPAVPHAARRVANTTAAHAYAKRRIVTYQL